MSKGRTQNPRRVNSLSQDAIYAVTSGHIKPSKHLKLGIAMKSLTGSRQVINILNRLGHVPSYNVIEEIETEMTFEISKKQHMMPDGFEPNPKLGTGLAWDNYDRYVESLTGNSTMHDTVGICYQTKPSVSDYPPADAIPSSPEPRL